MGKDFVIHAVKVYKEFPYINKKEDKQLSRKVSKRLQETIYKRSYPNGQMRSISLVIRKYKLKLKWDAAIHFLDD